jgi:hypothetical protein
MTATAAAQDTGVIRGSVYVTARHRMLRNAIVTLQSPATEQTTKTDASGRFAFWSVPPGPVWILIDAEGLEPVSFAACVHADTSDYFPVRLLEPIGSAAMWSNLFVEKFDFRKHLLDISDAADGYSVGGC